MSTQTDRLDDIKAALNELLEERIGHLLGVVRAAQSLTRKIVATEEDIQRQEHLMASVARESGGGAAGRAEQERRLASARAEVERMWAMREELVDQLSMLKVGDE